ncbi:MAG: YqaJ viral recombinase family protein [Rhodospirillaceae bacterium]
MTTHVVQQRTPEWFALRLGRLTASDAKDMLAVIKSGEAAARRDLRMRLVCERLTGQPSEDTYTNADMQRGVDLEPEARRAYEAHTGQLVDTRVGFISHDDCAAGCSPDGVVE